MVERVSIFIDGSNLYHSLKKLNGVKIDFEKLVNTLSKDRILINAFYYIAPLDITSNEKTYWKHQKFLAELEKIPKFKVVLCTLRKSLKEDGNFSFEVKGDDVHLANDLLVGAYENLYDSAILVSGDEDFIPVIDTLKKWNGSIIEVPYTKGISSTVYHEELKVIGTTPQLRMRKLRRLLEAKPLVRFLEAHNGLTGLIVEHTKIKRNQVPKEFDGIWISSLTDSTAKGRPDIEFVDLTSRLSTINQILDVTTKPIIVDGDTGGLTEHFSYTIRALERLGISAIIIEDKMGLKRNSLLGISVPQEQDTIENFSKKILTGKKAQVTEDFMIIARIESLILKKGVEDAIKRAKAYIEAGADGIMIHSREKEPDEILDFCDEYNKLENKVPLVAIPTTYSQVTEQELRNAGINIIIYANHLLRSSYLAMKRTAELILSCDRAQEAEQNCLSIDEILKLIPFDNNL